MVNEPGRATRVITRDVLFQADGIVAGIVVPDDGPALVALFKDCADFFELTTGLPPGPAEVQSLFTALPEGKTYRDKQVVSCWTPPAAW